MVLFLKKIKPIKIRNIKSFQFTYSKGAMKNASVEYTLHLSQDGYIASIKPYKIPKENAKTFTVNQTFVEELETFLQMNQVEKWNGFVKANKIAADGKGFTLRIQMLDETSLYAHGYMKWPKNYTFVQKGIEEIFSRLEQGEEGKSL